MSEFAYVGTELDLFAAATNWKSYLRSRVAPYLGRDVLEVGAGFGGTTRLLCSGQHDRWICLEPDPELAGRAADLIRAGDLPPCCQAVVGTTAEVAEPAAFDTILYIDVLEHIEDDAGEVSRAAPLLRPGGHLIALSPAHPWLYTPFDKAIGHYRRYTKRTLAALAPPGGLELVRLDYLDTVGLLASLGNKVVLNKAMPSRGQIATWDKLMVPISRLVDPVLAGPSASRSWESGNGRMLGPVPEQPTC